MYGTLVWVCKPSPEETQTGESLGFVGQSSKFIQRALFLVGLL